MRDSVLVNRQEDAQRRLAPSSQDCFCNRNSSFRLQKLFDPAKETIDSLRRAWLNSDKKVVCIPDVSKIRRRGRDGKIKLMGKDIHENRGQGASFSQGDALLDSCIALSFFIPDICLKKASNQINKGRIIYIKTKDGKKQIGSFLFDKGSVS